MENHLRNESDHGLGLEHLTAEDPDAVFLGDDPDGLAMLEQGDDLLVALDSGMQVREFPNARLDASPNFGEADQKALMAYYLIQLKIAMVTGQRIQS